MYINDPKIWDGCLILIPSDTVILLRLAWYIKLINYVIDDKSSETQIIGYVDD